MSEWTALRVAITTFDGATTVDGFVCAEFPGLAITRARHPEVMWAITHAASGRTVGPCAATLGNARDAVACLASAGDWTRAADDLWSDPAFLQSASVLLREMRDGGKYINVPRPVDDGIPTHIRERFATEAPDA